MWKDKDNTEITVMVEEGVGMFDVNVERHLKEYGGRCECEICLGWKFFRGFLEGDYV